ncbi:hypothetical protein OUZ56_005263 [Daphnia magna]|uniref:Uncharacterized protein n=1 Tax=Daphnia magna TaxID=35525 RepID=A0ABQ9YSA9_9CRUS|nr:hypothetical protein OUZ56_005263 [Daphnia magna]
MVKKEKERDTETLGSVTQNVFWASARELSLFCLGHALAPRTPTKAARRGLANRPALSDIEENFFF